MASQKWRLEGWDTFAGESYPLPGEYDSETLAVAAARRQLEELERQQPSESSGGQAGIQDKVYVVGPAGQRYCVERIPDTSTVPTMPSRAVPTPREQVGEPRVELFLHEDREGASLVPRGRPDQSRLDEYHIPFEELKRLLGSSCRLVDRIHDPLEPYCRRGEFTFAFIPPGSESLALCGMCNEHGVVTSLGLLPVHAWPPEEQCRYYAGPQMSPRHYPLDEPARTALIAILRELGRRYHLVAIDDCFHDTCPRMVVDLEDEQAVGQLLGGVPEPEE